MKGCPFLVLGHFVPKIWKAYECGEAITKITKKLGLIPHDDPLHGAQEWCPWYSKSLHAEVKKWTPPKKQGEEWHQDGDTTPGSKMDCALVLWASNNPTEFKTPDGKVWQPQPYQIVLARNLSCLHRRPPNCPEKRFMFRQRVKVPLHMGLP